MSEDEIESSDGESSDGIEITRRTTRGNAKGKGKEKETRRTTRAEAKVSNLIKKLQRRAIDGLPLFLDVADDIETQNIS